MQVGYLQLVDEILTHGRRVSPRGQPTIELPHTTIVLRRPNYATPVGIGRGLSLPLASAETTHLTAGISDAKQLVKITSAFSQFMNGARLLGAYGPRIYAQIPNMLVTLSRDSETRQAGVQIWRPDELEHDSKDVPCTLSLHWEVRNGCLDAFTVMRSNDVFLGVPYDVTMFTRLQLTLAWALGVAVGTYTHTAFSMHIYERDVHILEHLTAPDSITESPVLAYGIGRHDSNPGERFAQTSVARWIRARHWAKIAMLDLPTKVYSSTRLDVTTRGSHDVVNV